MKYQVIYTQECCAGCLRCEQACSNTYAKRFQPSVSHIRINAREMRYTADFTEECIECGVCADNCLFGALAKHPMENPS
jgi:formate hydrogenlyase subunit 6/NADH:ubiquinone oxidoreductase subunit I